MSLSVEPDQIGREVGAAHGAAEKSLSIRSQPSRCCSFKDRNEISKCLTICRIERGEMSIEDQLKKVKIPGPSALALSAL